MRKVSKEEFFAAINPLDVHPRTDMSTLRDRYIFSDWEMQHTRVLVGRSSSDSWGTGHHEYWLSNRVGG